MHILTIVGARPQFIKAAVVSRAIAQNPDLGIREEIIHTGQHYDENMSDIFFVEMGIPEPAVNLRIGSGSHGQTTARMLEGIEGEIFARRPDALLVYGDTNSTLAGALAAAKLHVPVVHVEAGLRSFNRRMPEEINRVLADHLSALLLCPTTTAVASLAAEGIAEGVHHVGDVMFDAARIFGEIAESRSRILADFDLIPGSYCLATVHRAENTDDLIRLKGIFEAFAEIAVPERPVVLPLHPRTKAKLAEHRIDTSSNPALRLVPPVSFLDMVMLEKNARLILTDSGGVQKEAYFHSVPCVTLRDETEWVETVEAGWNQIVGADPAAILNAARSAAPGSFIKDYGTGKAAERVVELVAGKRAPRGSIDRPKR